MSAFNTVRKAIQSTADKYGYQVERKYDLGRHRLDVLEVLVEQSKPDDPSFQFVQIGANDGEADDPINQMVRKYRWRGILLEPQPDVFKQLVENYRGFDRLIFENAALASTDGFMPFFSVQEQSGLSSFDRSVLVRSGFTDQQIVRTEVPTISPQTLLSKHNVTHVDLLQIDTEGFDFEVVKLMIAAGLRPSIINYEHVHLSTPDRAECVSLLGGLGYKMLQAGERRTDTVAFLVKH
jgi:FkbM family methyltransferase